MKKIGGITKRWLKDIFSVILVLVLSVSVAACLFIRTYYYTSIKNVLETNSGELITTFFNIYGANSEDGFAIAGREFIENCGMLDLMEISITAEMFFCPRAALKSRLSRICPTLSRR